MMYNHFIKQLGEEKVRALQEKTISIIGLGGIGTNIAEMLVRSGIQVRLIEKDRVLEQDMDRLSLFEEKQLTRFKATEAKKILSKINPHTTIKSFNEEITQESMFLANADLILDCSGDNELTPIISAYCKQENIPVMGAGIRGNTCIIISAVHKKTLQEQVETIKQERTEGLLPAATRIAAGLLYIRVIKYLLGEEKKDGMLVYDIWEEKFK